MLEQKTNEFFQFRKRILKHELAIHFSIPDFYKVKLLLTALLMLCLAYGLSFTHFPPTTLYGRLTSVHLAATFGGSLFFACLCSLGLSFARSHRFGFLAIFLLAAYLSLLVAYCFSIQLDFKQAWLNEQEFWSSAIEQTPDLEDSTIIFVLDHDLPATHFILTHSWADPIMLNQVLRFPAKWKTPPRLFVVPANWTEAVIRVNNQLEWEVPIATWPAHWEVLPNSNIILLEMENGKLVRRFGSISIQGQKLELKALHPNAKPDWKKGTLYPYFFPEAN